MAKTTKGEQRKAEIVQAAERLFYRQGIASTSFSDLARASGVPRGNFYFHFKDKESIVAAVVALREDELRQLIERLDQQTDPRRRLLGFVDSLVARAEQISQYGCPVGSMLDEIAKGELERTDAARLFDVLRTWMKAQFRELGLTSQRAEGSAIELLCRTQGINTLATAFADPDLVRHQARRVGTWLRSI